MQYTRADYIEAIKRELELRATTYPKIVAKKQKQWKDEGLDVMSLTIDLSRSQRIQHDLLHLYILMEGVHHPPQHLHLEIFRELQRELRMRKQCYPRWVKWGRMPEGTAAMELAVWQALTEYYHKTYVPDAPWKKPATRHARTS